MSNKKTRYVEIYDITDFKPTLIFKGDLTYNYSEDEVDRLVFDTCTEVIYSIRSSIIGNDYAKFYVSKIDNKKYSEDEWEEVLDRCLTNQYNNNRLKVIEISSVKGLDGHYAADLQI